MYMISKYKLKLNEEWYMNDILNKLKIIRTLIHKKIKVDNC